MIEFGVGPPNIDLAGRVTWTNAISFPDGMDKVTFIRGGAANVTVA